MLASESHPEPMIEPTRRCHLPRVPIALVYAELGVMLPLSVGVVRYPHMSFGSFAS
jgi:hypothetical protein